METDMIGGVLLPVVVTWVVSSDHQDQKAKAATVATEANKTRKGWSK